MKNFYFGNHTQAQADFVVSAWSIIIAPIFLDTESKALLNYKMFMKNRMKEVLAEVIRNLTEWSNLANRSMNLLRLGYSNLSRTRR